MLLPSGFCLPLPIRFLFAAANQVCICCCHQVSVCCCHQVCICRCHRVCICRCHRVCICRCHRVCICCCQSGFCLPLPTTFRSAGSCRRRASRIIFEKIIENATIIFEKRIEKYDYHF
ncbi:hypothetical protein [Methanimicrococcus hongohii]|uniref:hypothetical protein n=1 Tax=Methanimicrococcus hongohii TaxID=3028295 RepID=UPI00292D3E20|nr:hypothetical protein [Methanimicrococcus sp. Hf6]